MRTKKQCIFNWSGGKDSTLALHYMLQDPSIQIRYLVTSVTEKYNRVSMHGIRESLLIKQVKSIGIPLHQIRLPEMPNMETYDDEMRKHLLKFRNEGITHAIYGDIFLEDLKTYREERLAEVGLTGIFPLWNRNTHDVINEFLQLNYKTIIVCAQHNLKSFCGKVITKDLVDKFPLTIDPCGENGEFHTFAFEGPIFNKEIAFDLGDKVFRSYNAPKKLDNEDEETDSNFNVMGFWYIDLLD
ncbi:adenine nucleotide alpha hydrolase [Pedobacter mucosus]|uniref:adenine nucleotide alpha hydrolase n=1 Tax=Pedobacter mucosus TaxID=2895286 RepID=UPI001EE3ACDC|nr:adenine nucleotide alpha hydrolase [Pedobacter mucosus]UKT65531.1 adenine nucleotide alpha hydrolase [Pedobacter mucosus]